MPKRKPVIEMYWSPVFEISTTVLPDKIIDHVVNMRILGGNGEVVWHNTQGYKDRSAAFQAVVFLQVMFGQAPAGDYKIRGPGRKPKA